MGQGPSRCCGPSPTTFSEDEQEPAAQPGSGSAPARRPAGRAALSRPASRPAPSAASADAPRGAQLSAGKAKFLASGIAPVGAVRQLPLGDIRRLAHAYASRLGVDIRFNGGPQVLQASRARQWQARLAEFEGDSAYANVAFDVMGEVKGLPEHGRLAELLVEEPAALAQAVRELPVLHAAFTKAIERERDAAQREVNEAGLPIDHAAEALLDARRAAAETGQAAVILHATKEHSTMGCRGVHEGTGHVCAYVVTPRSIIVPVHFGQLNDAQMDWAMIKKGQRVARAHLDALIHPPRSVGPQAGLDECGSLALSYAKELLKSGAAQLRKHCLVMTGTPDISDFFLPSPDVLRYSQSDLYIKLLRAMVAGDDDKASVEHQGETFEITTLAGLRRQGAQAAYAMGDAELDFDAFRRDWVDRLDSEVLPRRQAMATTHEGRPGNAYLAHVVTRHEARARYLASDESGTPGAGSA